jgi:hypothetical protein
LQEWILKYWITALFGAVTASLSWMVKLLWQKQKCQTKEHEAIKEGMLALLHDRIYQSYTICENKGYASIHDLENLEFLYQPYHSLGGNGTGTELFERMKKMPVDPAERGNI